ncbi:MAG: glycoside hydrolase family 32 protein [Firmicutes bacterium]|nr:glycoside hydrolase family 32 protein [Bacillota bacterium]
MNVLLQYLSKQVDIIEKDAFSIMKQQKWRAGYHLMPPVGWLNDPNGLCMYQGEYHIFFQYSPFDVEGGLKFWGHYKSKDMLHWQYLGVSLYSDQPYDVHGAYSGCAFIENGKMYLYYTGNIKLEGDFDYINEGRQSNTILVESDDGIHFKEKKCILTQKDYSDGLTLHVRDPKVWKENNTYYMVLGARTKQQKGVVLLYISDDKVNWKFKNTLTTEQNFGYMWECPDLFELEGQKILSVSPQGLQMQGRNYQNIHQSGYFLMQGDYENYTLQNFKEWDRGFDFYAPQTFLDEKGRRILIGWAGIPDEKGYTNPTVKQNWQHMLTMPRELKYQNGKIYQMPVQEIKQLRQYEIAIKNNMTIIPSFELEINNKSGESFSIEIDNDAIIKFDKEQCYFEVCFKGEMGAGRKSRSVDLKQCNKVNLFVDKSILEIYINEGEEVFCTRFYPQNDEIVLYYHCDIEYCKMWHMNSYSMGRNMI